MLGVFLSCVERGLSLNEHLQVGRPGIPEPVDNISENNESNSSMFLFGIF